MTTSQLSFRRTTLSLSLCALLISLVPAHPLKEESEIRTREASNIYWLLESHNMELSYPAVWNVAETISVESKKYSLDPMLVVALINVESRFRHRAVSTEGARGLMQLLPSVAGTLAGDAALEQWEGEKSLDDPVTNIKLGIYYLSSLKKRFGDLQTALTAYCWGPTRVQQNLESGTALPLEYATKILSTSRGYRERFRQTQDKRQVSTNI
jgi:soluble lytic murein transglycosylase